MGERFKWLISKLFHVWDLYVRCCFASHHELVPLRMTPRTVDGFESTCVMKDIWSIKAYSFSVPFNWWARGWAGQCPQALSALVAQGVQHTLVHTHIYTNANMLWQAILHKPSITLTYPVLISSLCALDCREGNHLILGWMVQHLVSHWLGLTVC